MPEYVTISDAMIKATQAVKELKLRNETLEAGLNTAIDQLDILLHLTELLNTTCGLLMQGLRECANENR